MDTNVYEKLAGPVLGILATYFIPWVRQFKGISDWWIPPIGFVLGLIVYLIVHPMTPDWRLELLSGITGVVTFMLVILGGGALGARVTAGTGNGPQANTK